MCECKASFLEPVQIYTSWSHVLGQFVLSQLQWLNGKSHPWWEEASILAHTSSLAASFVFSNVFLSGAFIFHNQLTLLHRSCWNTNSFLKQRKCAHSHTHKHTHGNPALNTKTAFVWMEKAVSVALTNGFSPLKNAVESASDVGMGTN